MVAAVSAWRESGACEVSVRRSGNAKLNSFHRRPWYAEPAGFFLGMAFRSGNSRSTACSTFVTLKAVRTRTTPHREGGKELDSSADW